MFEKAFRLAIDLNDHDLFMDIHFSAVALNDTELATAAKERAESILSRSNSRRSSRKYRWKNKSIGVSENDGMRTPQTISVDSTCSRASCSLCSDLSDEKDEEEEEEEEETYSEESGDSRKQERAGLKQSKRHYRKVGSSQIPPLPVVNPHRDLENSLSAPYTDIPSSNKSDYNLVPPSFDAPNSGILTTATFNHSSPMSISSPFLASTSFNKPLYKTHSNFSNTANTTNIIDSSSAFNNTSDDLMTTSFGSLSLTESEVTIDDQPAEAFGETSYDKPSLLNEIPYSFNGASANVVTACAQEDSFVSTAFNKPVYEPEDTRPEYPSSSLDTIDSNIMSTSFSTRVPSTLISHNNPFNVLTTNSKSETTCPMLRNAKSSSEMSDNTPSRTLTEVFTTTKSSSSSSSILYGTCNNLMSTSFNYPEADVASINDTYIDAFNSGNDQAIKLQHPIAEKKERVFNIPPPPPSLTSSRTNYLHGLPRKNYPLSRSSPGLTSDIDESVHKFSSYKTHMPLSSRILQRQNSAINIPQNQKTPSRIYRYNYDLDYVPFHHGATTCDDADSQRSPQTVAAGNRKFDPLQNLQSSYSVQRRLLESRHLSRSSQSNVSVNASKETKMSCNVPPLPVINTSMTNSKIYAACPSFSCDAPVSSNEKPKVKFSDTVTHILVPSGVVSDH